MSQSEKEAKEIQTNIGGHNAKMILRSPAEIEAEQKRKDKTTAMKMTFAYIDSQRKKKVSQEETMDIADKYVEWLKK